MFKKLLVILAVITLIAPFAWAGERVVTVGGNQATRPLTDFTLSTNGVGDTYYVDSVTGDDGRAGKSPATALATLDAAVGKCTANQGDIIYVLAGHTEALGGADGVDVDVAGVTIVGLGYGEDMPEFTYDAVDDEFVIGAANVTVMGLRFVAGISDVVMGISVEAAGDNFTLKDCVFPKPSTNSFEFLDAIDIADGANYITVKNCEYYNDEGGAAANHFIEAGNGTAGPERLQVVDCYIKGDFAVSAIWSDEPCDEALIVGNTIINHTTGQHCIEFTDTGTGVIVGNNLYGDTEGSILDPGSMYIFNNNLSTAIDLDGIPLWVVNNGLNHLCALDGATQVYPENAADDSILAKMLSKSDPADISDYDCQTDSLEAIADRGVTILADTAELQPVAAKAISKTISTITNGNHNLFVVAGGPIKIIEIAAYVATEIGAEGNLVNYNIDPTAPASDTVFGTDGTALETNADAVGTLYTWDGVIANDLTATTNGVALGVAAYSGLIVPAGSIELACANDGSVDGAITVYMRYIPLSTSSAVTAAP